ncbi:MAG: HAMP domain-containing histidine kinase, partial [Paludibacteraceae bacterium]|nr:HAMP domain-containing histidine kinase [Paludibacteraceae bacterium]
DIIIYDSNGFQHSASSSDLKGLGARRKNENASHIMNANSKCNLTQYPKTVESILGKKYATEYAYLYNANNVQVGYVQVLNNVLDKNRNSDVFNYIVFVLDAFLIVITLSFLVVWWINMRISAPIYEISNKLQRLQLTNANEKIYYSNKNDEIGQLVSRYNAMVDELVVSAEKLARSERETAWRDMARSIAHEIKNPLTPMKLSIQAAQRKQEVDPEHFEEYFNHTADLLVEQIENLARIATEFSDFAKVTAVEPERVDIVVRLRNAVALYLHNPEGVIVQSDITVNHPVYILGNEKQLMQVFNNLIRNAIQAIPEDQMGFVNVSLSTTDMNVEVRIKDNGTGVKPDIQKRMFEPNFTTKNSGMGLGLAITKSIVTACKGDISFETEEGVGTTFIVKFPIIN